MDTSLSASPGLDRLGSTVQKDLTSFTDNDGRQPSPIPIAGIQQLVSRLSATLPYRSRRQSVQLTNQIIATLGELNAENPLDPDLFQQLFCVISNCWLSAEFEPVAIALLCSALKALSNNDFRVKITNIAQQAFAAGSTPVQSVFHLRVLSNFPEIAPSLVANSCLDADGSLDLVAVRYALNGFWKMKSSDPNFSEELQLNLISSRLLASPVAPVLLFTSLADWLEALSSVESDSWKTIAFGLERMLHHPSDRVRESALQLFCQLEKVSNPNFAYWRYCTLTESFSLNALGTSFQLPTTELGHFWSMLSLSPASKTMPASKVLSAEEYVDQLGNLFHVPNTLELNELRLVSVNVAMTLIHDKLRTLGTVASTIDDIIQRLAQGDISPESNIAVTSFLYALNALVKRIYSQQPELQVSFPTAIPFFLSKRFIYDGFSDKVKPQRLQLAYSNPSAIHRSVLFSEFASADLVAVAVPFCWALKQSVFLKRNIDCVSKLLNQSSNGNQSDISVLVEAIKFHSQDSYGAAIQCYFSAVRSVSDENAEIAWNGTISCIRTLQLWDSAQELISTTDAACNKNIVAPNSIQKLLLDSSYMLHTGQMEQVRLLLDQNWANLKDLVNLQSEPISTIVMKCQLWIIRLQSLGFPVPSDQIVSEAKEFLSEVVAASYLCTSYIDAQEILAYNQLLSCILEPSFNVEQYLTSATYQTLPMLSELFIIHPSQKVLSRLLIRAHQTGNAGFVSRLLQRVSAYEVPTPELKHSVIVCSELSKTTLLDLWRLSESSNNAEITLSLIDSLMRSPLDFISPLPCQSESLKLFSLVDDAFRHSQELSCGSLYAKWCIDQTGVLGDGWFNTAAGVNSTSRIPSLLAEVFREFISDSEQLENTVKAFCTEIFEHFKSSHVLPPSKLFSMLSSALALEIDWQHIASESSVFSEFLTLISRVPDLLTRAAKIIYGSLSRSYSYNDALLLVALLEIGYFVDDCHLPDSTWTDIIPQLQAMLRRSDLPESLTAKVQQILLKVARQTCEFEQIAFPLTDPKIDNPHLEELAQGLKLWNVSLWNALCDFSNHMRKLSYFSDDKWIDLLSRLISDIPSRLRWWGEECEQGQPFAESYGSIMQSILDAVNNASLEVSLNSNCEEPRLFYEKFGHQIQTLWLHLCLPLQAVAGEIDKKALLSAICHQMKALKHDIQLLSKVDIRVVCPGISMSSLAFRLPGMPIGCHSISLANPMVEILKTKTRPRMMSFLGSDGLAYSYLLKGKEDLNIDQRILQVASYVNDMMAKSSDANLAGFSPIPTYSVTCLSSEAGLISIVPDTTSLFRLNRFGPGSDRDSTGSQALEDNDQKDVAESTPAQVYLFNLHQVLEEHNLSPKTPRSEWPSEVFTSLYDRLVSEADDSILEKRLYLSSLSPEQEFHKRALYTSTLASSSMLGYLLGIGDRHLGNILMRIETGEVVHIDFAVSFDAGRSLRVPESVPFRLTPCLRRALGPFSLPTGQFAHMMALTHRLCRLSKPYIITILRALWNHPIEGWNPRRRRIMKRDVDRAMVHKLIVARLQRSRAFLEALHNWVLGSHSHWLELVASYNHWAVAHNESALKDAEISVLQHRTSSAEQAILILPDLLEQQKAISSKLESAQGTPEGNELSQKLQLISQQLASARELISSLPLFRKDLKAAQVALAAVQAKRQNVTLPSLAPADEEMITTLQSLWANIRSLLGRLSQDEFPVVQQLRSDWDQLQDTIKTIYRDFSVSTGAVKLVDGRKAFSSFFSTLKSFIKTDLPNLPSPDPRLRATQAISDVAERISSTDKHLVQDLITQATDKDKLARMFQGWAAWV